MKLILGIYGLVLLIQANSIPAFEDDPYAVLDAADRFTNSAKITWIVVDDATVRCQAESHKRNFGGFPKGVEACSFWNEKGVLGNCTIITDRFTNYIQIAHETLHCFKGAFHD